MPSRCTPVEHCSPQVIPHCDLANTTRCVFHMRDNAFLASSVECLFSCLSAPLGKKNTNQVLLSSTTAAAAALIFFLFFSASSRAFSSLSVPRVNPGDTAGIQRPVSNSL